MRSAAHFRGFASLDRHRRVGIVLAGVCLVAMAVGITPNWSVGQMVGGAMAVLAFGSVIALATAPRRAARTASIVGRVDGASTSGRRAA